MSIRLGPDAVLRPLRAADARELHALVEANRDHLRPWMPWAENERGDTDAFLTAAEEQAAARNGLQLAIAEHDRIAGVAGVHAIDGRNASTTIGYWLAADAVGRGLATRAVSALLEECFGAWRLHRVEIRAAPANARSRAVAERLGFTNEGVAPAAERFPEGLRDLVVYALLATDWRARDR